MCFLHSVSLISEVISAKLQVFKWEWTATEDHPAMPFLDSWARTKQTSALMHMRAQFKTVFPRSMGQPRIRMATYLHQVNTHK